MAKKNYNILKNDTFGRYMVADKNIKAGQLLLTENPVLVGPQLNGPLICFNCCSNIRSGYIFCKECNKAIICSPKCTGALHTADECSVLKQLNIEGKILAQYDQIVFPLRCILLKKYNSDVWESFLELESHLESRRNTPIWRRHKVTVEQILREINFLSEEDLKDELVQKVCGILDVNTFEVRQPKCSTEMIINPSVQCLRGLYLEAALMAHDCQGNTHLSVDEDFVLTVHASVDITENSPIFFNYSNVLQGTPERKQFLREGKYFECSCARCEDVTELGTNLSSLKCHVCHKGTISLLDPYKVKSDWECNHCKKKFGSGLINSTVEEGRRLVQELGRPVYLDHSSIGDMETLLAKLSRTFHFNHYLMLELRQNMAGLYARLPPNKNNLSRKIDLCQALLEVFTKIEPGLSRMKALTLYELQSALIDLAHKQYKDQLINLEELVTKLLSAECTLKEAIKHLLYEPTKSPEGRIAQRALSELKTLRVCVASMQSDLLSSSDQLEASRRSGRKLKLERNDQATVLGKEKDGIVDLEESKLKGNKTKSDKRKKNKKK